MLLATALLAGCAEKAPPPPPAPTPEPVVEAPPAPVAKIPVPRRKPTPPSAPSDATIAAPEALPSEPVSPPPDAAPPPVIAPIKLDGMEAADVEKRLGPPQVQADSPPAVVWRYAAGDCAVDVYLYKDLQSGALRALFVDVKGDDRSDQRREACLQRLAERHAADAPPPG